MNSVNQKWRIILLLASWLSSFTYQAAAASISGKVTLSPEWKRVIYLSEIRSFDDVHTASFDFLRYQAIVDSSGRFAFVDLDLADGDRLYRLHVCKKGDPVSTIIIGGQKENFVHFLMNPASRIVLQENGQTPGLSQALLKGHPAGKELTALFQLQKKLNAPPPLPSAQNRAFVQQQVQSALSTMADTSSNTVISLLATYLLNDNFPGTNHLPLMEKVHSKLAYLDHTHPYYNDFSKQLNFLQFQQLQHGNDSTTRLLWMGIILLLLLIAAWWWKHQASSKRPYHKEALQSLTNQERKVLTLLKEGKSNKEISSALHIEVSTVKSHLYKIYSRLGVKSRKEIQNKDQ